MGLKNGYFFTLDALLALFILFTGLMLLSNIYTSSQPRTQLSFYSEDIITILSDLKVDELNNSYLAELIANGNITDMDNSILDQIGLFWVTNKTGLAIKLAQNISHDLIPERYGFSFVVGDDIVYSRPKLRNKELVTYKSMITGIEKERPIKGSAARIYFHQVSQTMTSRYAYLGGFVGQGNISVSIKDVPADADIIGMYMEVDAGSNFSLSINGLLCNTFNISYTNMSSDAWDISYCNSSIIKGGDNNFTISFDDTPLNASFIGGGFIKISYFTKDIFIRNTSSHSYVFPGIAGIVNLYDGFVVPGSLNYMEVFLHYLANHSMSNNTFYLTIGNDVVYRDNESNTTVSVTLNNSYLSSVLNYTQMSNQTVPIRVGFENLSYESIITDKGKGDVVAITDVSGSMDWEFDSTNSGVERFCKDMKLNDEGSMRLAVAKCILKTFSHDILYNITGNRVGLVTYSNSIRNTLDLITNLTRLTDEINTFYASGSTCTSCGVVRAANLLLKNGLVDLLSKKWTYTNDYQSADPANWFSTSYDDSSWQEGYQKFGFGIGSDTYTGNVIQANLWDMSNDAPAPVDFTSGVNYTQNTFGFGTTVIVEDLLENSFFDGPSTAQWTENGNINLSDSGVIIFNDDFETDQGWTHGGTREQWHHGTPLGRGGAWHGNPDPDFAHSGSNIWGEDCTNPFWNGDYRSNADSRLTSPIINCSSCSNTLLRFYRWLNVEQPAFDQSRVRVTDAGGAWHTVWTNPAEMTDSSWSLQEIDISAFADANPNLQIRFGTQTDGGWEYSGWNIDDVQVVSDANAHKYFQLDDYWFIDSDSGSFASLSQSFRSPTATPNNVTINLVHSINYSHFSGAADVFCNLTYPGGEDTVWTEHWDSGSLPAEGPIAETIDITDKVTSSGFTYGIECGANVSGPGQTLVAFDNMTVMINWTNNGDDGWDWQQGVYGYAGSMVFFPDGKGDLELAANTTSADASGSYGLQVLITQAMIDAMNSAGGSAWLSFNYRWDARDDGTADVFDTGDQAWIKGYWQKPSSALHWLGSEMSAEDGDTSPEIWTADDPDTEGSGMYTEEISGDINEGPGYYYLALGGKLHRDDSSKFGAFSFDNIQLAFINSSGNTFYRNNFFVSDLDDVHNPINLTITSDSGADVYLNSNLLDSYAGAQTNRNIAVVPGDFKQGENVLAVKLKNSDSTGRLQLDFFANLTGRQKAMVIMSDGESNDCEAWQWSGTDGACNDCGGIACCPDSNGNLNQPCPSIAAFAGCGWSDEYRHAAEQLVNLSCYYNHLYNISIYSVAFGDVAQCGRTALNLSALCDPDYTPDNTHYFESADPEGLASIYGQIANELRIAFSVKQSQIISLIGEYENSYLFPDSYILLNYNPIVNPIEHGEVPIFFESPDFKSCSYDLFIPSQIRPFEAYLLSYSAEHWTDYVAVNNSHGTMVAFNLSRFNNNYANLGDPFPIPIPGSYLASGEINTIIVRTGDNAWNSTNCSDNTTLFYTGLMNLVNYTLPYSMVLPNASGCNWTIEHDLGFNFSVIVPNDYTGSEHCEYTNYTHNTSGFSTDDAYDLAMYNLLSQIDYDNNGKVFLNFDENDFIINSKVVRDIPYLWGPTITEVRVWQ